MNDTNIHNEQQPIPLNQALKECRLAANLSVDELAQRLNLKSSVILNLENNLDKVISDGIYPLIYLRGYLINYSKELKLPNIESYAEFQQLSHPSESVTSLQNTYVFNDGQKLSKKILLVTLFTLVVGGIGIVYFDNTTVNDVDIDPITSQEEIENIIKPLSSTEKIVETPVKEVLEEVETEEFIAVPDVIETVSKPVVEESKKTVVEEINKPVAVKSEVTEVVVEKPVDKATSETEKTQQTAETTTLKLLFEEESWAVVMDAKNKRLAFGLYQAGKELDLVGSAPFALKLGNPTGVVMYYDDQLIEKDFVQGKMAKFSLPE